MDDIEDESGMVEFFREREMGGSDSEVNEVRNNLHTGFTFASSVETSSAEAGSGRDIQGIPWDTLSTNWWNSSWFSISIVEPLN